jgi:predicted metalloprotease with PDZ domain
MSLIEASERRWETNSNFLYAKGMVVAFLCDVAMIKESGGRKDLRTLLRNVFQKYRGAAAVEANQALTETMRSYSELGPIVTAYVTGKNVINWESELASAGLRSAKDGFRINLSVVDKPSGKQKDLLDKLGYNQWRKLLK